MKYTVNDLIRLIPQSKRDEFCKIYDSIHQKVQKEENIFLQKASECFDIPVKEIKGRGKPFEIVFARQLCVVAMRICTPKTLKKIGEIVGKDHTTVLHSLKVIKNDYNFVPERKEMIRTYISLLDNRHQNLMLKYLGEKK